jgi:DNA-binding transcriptional regulator YiaG
MKKCLECGHTKLSKTTERLEFNNVAAVEGVVYTCDRCAARYEGFAKVEELSREVAHHVARGEERLSPDEIRFLRKYLGYSSKDFAAFLDVSHETVSRWESRADAKPMKLATEKLLRYMALVDKPISDYGLDKAGTKAKHSKLPTFINQGGRWRPRT